MIILIKNQFYNPSTGIVLKSSEGKTFNKESLSVIAIPQGTEFNEMKLRFKRLES